MDNKKDIVNLIAQTKKQFNRFIEKNRLEIEEIEPLTTSYFCNHKAIEKGKKGELICHIDINHAYWRTAFLLGYISERYYKKTYQNDDLKLHRNVALACTIAPKKKTYCCAIETPFL